MRNLLAWIAVGLSCITGLYGQQSEHRQMNEVIKIEKWDESRPELEAYRGQDGYYLPVKLNQLPDQQQQQRFKANGIELISYQQNQTYLAKIPRTIKAQQLADLGIIAVQPKSVKNKIAKDILEQNFPDRAVAQAGWLDVAIGVATSKRQSTVRRLLAKLEAEILETQSANSEIILARVPSRHIDQIATLPVVTFIDILQEPDRALNHEIRTIQRVNLLNNGYDGVPGLNGSGVAIGIGDGGQLGEHIDFDSRVINKANGTYSSFGSHGDHVAGIIGGAGHIDPRNRGVASEATIITQKTSLITYYAEEYFQDYGMVLTNNSYGTSFNCATNGSYNYSSLTLDKQMRELPEMLHVFAAGNSGGNSCPDYPQGYRTVLRYYQAAKNVLTVGNTNKDRTIRNNSSRGPVADGRVKPEIVAVGSNVVSTGRDFNYFSSSGTSMSAPAVTATLSLLYERYRQLNGGNNPQGALVKAIACNTAEDLGNPGPDYVFGYGLINGRRAIEVLNNRQYVEGTINQGEQKTHTISLPDGVKRVKAMLYWHDKEAEAFAEKALVNDLDLQLVSPSGQTYLPWVLDHHPAKVNLPATRGLDTLNNIEQVTLDNPGRGIYQVVIDGSEIPLGAQSYVIVYDFIKEDLTMTYPSGGETFTPGTREYIQWDAEGTNQDLFVLEYSSDGGQTWENLVDEIDEDVRQFIWTVPNQITEQGQLRISKIGSNGVSAQNQMAFTILDAPAEVKAIPYCNGFVGLYWNDLGISDLSYEVSIFDGEQMSFLATVSDTNYIIKEELEIGEKYWFSVSAVLSPTAKSERAVATFCVPDPDQLCPWRNDPQLLQLEVTERGRFNTTETLRDDEPVEIVVRNVGINTLDSVLVTYQVNNQTPVSEWVKTTIASGDTLFYEFKQRADLSAVGTYKINTWVNLPDDENLTNDSLINKTIAIQLANDQVQLPLGNNFGDATERTYTQKTIGLEGASALDFDLAGNGQLLVKDGAFYLLPDDQSDTSLIDNDLIVTIDLTDYINRTPMMVMHYKYYSLETGVGPLSEVKRKASSLWVRGSDADEWVWVEDLTNESDWTAKNNIRIKEALQAAGQQFSASTQIRFRHSDSFGLAVSDIIVEEILALPVEWIDFQAEATANGQISLTWSTMNEDNNDHFEILAAYEQEEDEGMLTYHSIGTVSSTAFNHQRQDYQFTDHGLFGDRVFYQIRQVDRDGQSSRSPIRSVNIKQPIPNQIHIYPNPFDAHINVTTHPAIGQIHLIRLMDTQGRIIQVQENTNTKSNHQLQLIPLAAGQYFLELHHANGISRHKIVKL